MYCTRTKCGRITENTRNMTDYSINNNNNNAVSREHCWDRAVTRLDNAYIYYCGQRSREQRSLSWHFLRADKANYSWSDPKPAEIVSDIALTNLSYAIVSQKLVHLELFLSLTWLCTTKENSSWVESNCGVSTLYKPNVKRSELGNRLLPV